MSVPFRLAAPCNLPVEVLVPWTGVVGHGIVCQGSYPTTLTPRTVFPFFTDMHSPVTTTSNTAHDNTNGTVGTGDAAHASNV